MNLTLKLKTKHSLMNKLPRHIIIEDKKEVWFVGSSTLAMGLKSIMNKHFPGYKGCLASQDYFEELKNK